MTLYLIIPDKMDVRTCAYPCIIMYNYVYRSMNDPLPDYQMCLVD